MEEKEEKGFVFKDRRKISVEDSEREADVSRDEKLTREEEGARAKYEEASREEEKARVPLPEVTFSLFVLSLNSSALYHLGEIPEPDGRQAEVDLPMAKQIIDTLGMLQDKTRGNLEPDEERLLKTVLYDLRLRFVQKSGG
ncbi:MAG: DUF1844 domain-containing protein [Syntrophobacteraceae bacterium]|jgi:hypothetical protein|nr:DUF1844 domain-containing protein [Syntrophobacteraceae bacterium]